MAPNRRRELLQVNSEIQQQGGVDRAGMSSGLSAVAQSFAAIGKQVGAIADHAARKEGAAAGREAGLDPEFRPTRSLTIRGEAFDEAGLAVYRVRAKQRFQADLQSAFDQHAGDPAALDGALKAKRDAWVDSAPREVRPELELLYEGQRLSMMRRSARAQSAALTAERAQAAEDEVAQITRRIQQEAYDLGLDETADEVLAARVDELMGALSATGVNGEAIYSREKAREVLEDTQKSVAEARLLGALERTGDLEAKRAFVEKFREDFGDGKGRAGLFDFDDFDKINRRLERELSRAESARAAELRAVAGEIDDAQKQVEKGYALTDEARAQLRAKAAAANDPALTQSLRQLDALAEFQDSARAAPPGELQAFVDQERQRLQSEGGSEPEIARLELADKLLGNMRTELKRDPLGYAERTGTVPIPDLDLSDGETAQASMKARIAAAEQTAAFYSQDPVYLRPDERRALASTIAQGGKAGLAVASAVTRAAGPERALAVMSELSDEAPVTAYLGALVARTGITPAAHDAATALELKAELGSDFKPLAPSKAEARTEAVSELGDALRNMPKTEAAVTAVANQIYETRARRQGIDTFDPELWRQGLREALGQREVGGEVYGGVVSQGFFGGQHVIVPPIIRRDGFDEVVDMITHADLAAAELGNPVGGDGETVPLDRMKNATLVQLGDGQYALATGDPDTPGAEQWIFRDEPGQPYILDFYALRDRLEARRPDLFLGESE